VVVGVVRPCRGEQSGKQPKGAASAVAVASRGRLPGRIPEIKLGFGEGPPVRCFIISAHAGRGSYADDSAHSITDAPQGRRQEVPRQEGLLTARIHHLPFPLDHDASRKERLSHLSAERLTSRLPGACRPLPRRPRPRRPRL